jgi:ABC-2 type transport system permease protein
MIVDRLMNSTWVQQNPRARSLLVGAWLGWQIESNWADPLLFFIYSIARPIASVLILVIMYAVVAQTDSPTAVFSSAAFAYLYLGNGLYILVGNVITGVSMAVTEDREHYRTNKQLYTTPMDGYSYMLGRGMAKLMIGLISVVLVVVGGVLFFQLQLAINPLLLLVSSVLGVASLAAMGVMLGALTLSMARHFYYVGEGVGAALYMFTGAIFPLGVLPAWLQPVGYVIPATYWLELSRRALLGPNMLTENNPLAGISDAWLLVALTVMTAFLVAVSGWYYTSAMRRARDNGVLDMESNY